MKAAFLLSPKTISIDQVLTPVPGKSQVSIQPTSAGICGSDVSLFLGHRSPPAYPLLLGHELVGRIVETGADVTHLKVGQRVIVEPNFTCGVCAFCRSGRSNICSNKQSLGVNIPGCFGESFVAPAEFVWRIPDNVSDQDAVTIEPLAVSLHALWQSNVQMGSTIAVIGCGATGLLLIQAAVAQGMRVIAHDKIAGKLEMARNLGALVPTRQDVAELWQSEDVSTVFECAGVTSTVELALSSVPRGGQVTLVGLANSTASFVPLRLVREGIRVTGSIIYNHPNDFSRAIDLVARGVVHPGRIVTDTLPFTDITHALDIACGGQAGKVVLQM